MTREEQIEAELEQIRIYSTQIFRCVDMDQADQIYVSSLLHDIHDSCDEIKWLCSLT